MTPQPRPQNSPQAAGQHGPTLSSGATPDERVGPRVVPGPGDRIPFSEVRAIQQRPLAALLDITRRYGDLVKYPVGFWRIYLVNHPEAIKQILQENHRNYSKQTFQFQLLSTITGQGLLTSDGAFWLRQRRLAQPAFHREALAVISTRMSTAIDTLLARWAQYPQGQALDIDAEMMHLTLEIVGQALFGIDLSASANVLAHAVLTVLDQVIYRARTPLAPPSALPTPRNRRFRAALRTLDEAVAAIISQRRRQPQGSSDLLALLMAAQDEETGAQMSDAQLRDEIITLIIAGHETVASALTWCWYFLSTHPGVARALRAEVGQVLAGRAPTIQDLPNLTYTRMVLEEVLRLYPPAWITTRRAIGPDTLLGYPIPAGALIVLSPYVTHRHPDFWENPEGFDPERFAPHQAARRPRFAYFPFGGGPRLCIGNSFAMIESQLVLASVVQRYALHLVPGVPVQPTPLVTLRPSHGLWMTLHRAEG